MGGAAMRFVLNLGNGCELYDSAKTHPFATTASIVLMKEERIHKRFKYTRSNRTSRDEAIETATNYMQHMNNEHKIEVKDLRIGNMVWRPTESSIHKMLRHEQIEYQYGRVTNIGPKAWMCDHRVKGMLCKPITVNEGILSAFGFFKYDTDPNRYCIGIDELRTLSMIPYFHIKAHLLFIETRSLGTRTEFPKRVEYVHELQNAYYTITGEDLLYKPQ